MEAFEYTVEFKEEFISFIESKDEEALSAGLEVLYPADIVDVFDAMNLDQAVYLTNLMSVEKRVDVLAELSPDMRKRFFEGFTTEQIALDFIQHMDSDDAADVLSEIPAEEASKVISLIPDNSFSLLLSRLMRYPEDTAGGLMAGELIKVEIDWDVKQCTEEIRKQAEDVDRVYTVYVVDENDRLKGWISLKKILLAKASTPIVDLVDSNVKYGHVADSGEEIASSMQKYDLIAMPIVDGLDRLVGRVTIDDVVDFIKDEANEDYQKLSGLSENVESRDGVWLMTRARLPWLVVGLVGGLLSSLVIGSFEGEIAQHVALAFFMPLVMAMGGNAGVQSSAIVVQGLANNTMQSGQVLKKLGKEFMVALINGLVCSLLALLYGLVTGLNQRIGFVVSISLLAAIVIASIVGALIPLLLDKYKIDPALATGPFITTSNDLLGLFVYFYIGYLML